MIDFVVNFTLIKVDEVEFIFIAEVLEEMIHMFKKLGKTTPLFSVTMFVVLNNVLFVNVFGLL